MKKFYYYARLNNNDVCTEIVSRVSRLVDVQGYVEIPEYNETLRYRKWLGDQWSTETYEPDVDTILQDKVEGFENLVEQQNDTIQGLLNSNNSLSEQITLLEGTIAELMMILGGMQ